jgi:zinc protease
MKPMVTAMICACWLTGLTGLTGRAGAAAEEKTSEQKLPENQVVQLPVGDDPTISLRIWFKVGAQNDPPGKEGLAALTAAMLTEGSTRENSYEQILEKLFPLAAGYAASPSMEMTVISGRVHKDNLARYYPLFRDALLAPAWKPEDLDRLKKDTLNYLQNSLRYASDEDLGKAMLYQQIFAGTPYGHLTEGTIESVQAITLDDLRKFYQEHYTRENVVIGIGGGYDAALLERLRQDLTGLPPGKPAEVPAPRPQPIGGLKVTIVEKETAATAISIGFPIDLLRGQPDWYALAVANSWFGQHRNSSSHLYQVIREERGLNYGDYSYIEHFPHGGALLVPPQNVCRRQQIFEMWIRPVPNDARHFALRAALRELKRLVQSGLTEAEFALTRDFLGKYVLNYAPTTMTRLGYALDDSFYGIRGSHLEIFRRTMGTVTREQVNAAVKKYLQADNMQIVLVTRDAQSLRRALVEDLPSPIQYPTPKPETVLREDEEISRFPLKVKAEDVKIVPVAELFAK